MAHRRTLDEIVEEIEHARPVHPLRALIAHHFYLDDWVSSEGGLFLVKFNAPVRAIHDVPALLSRSGADRARRCARFDGGALRGLRGLASLQAPVGATVAARFPYKGRLQVAYRDDDRRVESLTPMPPQVHADRSRPPADDIGIQHDHLRRYRR